MYNIMTVDSNTAGYEFTGGSDLVNPTYTNIHNITSYSPMTGGGKKSKQRRRPSKKVRELSKMKLRNIRKFNKRKSRQKNRLRNRSIRKDIIRA